VAFPTFDELQAIRDHIPETWTPTEEFDNAAVYQTFSRLGSVEATVAALLRRKQAFELENPDTFSVPGEYSQSSASGVSALRERVRIAEAAAEEAAIIASGASAIQVREIVRENPPGR
jgi:hypothetical protein